MSKLPDQQSIWKLRERAEDETVFTFTKSEWAEDADFSDDSSASLQAFGPQPQTAWRGTVVRRCRRTLERSGGSPPRLGSEWRVWKTDPDSKNIWLRDALEESSVLRLRWQRDRPDFQPAAREQAGSSSEA